PRNVSSVTPVDLSQDRCRKPSRSLRSNHSSLRRPPFRRPMFPPLRIVAMSLLTGGGRSERCCHLLGLPRSGLSYDLWVEVAAGIHRIESPLGARFMAQYVLAGDARTLLVDTGMPDTPARVLRPYLDSVGLGLEALDDVLVSHADNDHVGGN